MKTKIFMMLAAATVLSAACQSNNLTPEAVPEAGRMVKISVNGTVDNIVKTVLDGTTVTWNTSAPEKLLVLQTATVGGTPNVVSAKSAAGVSADAGAHMTFDVSFATVDGASNFAYDAFYPAADYTLAETGTDVTLLGITTPAEQTPTATSFDTDADLLVAKPHDAGASQPSTLNLRFRRMIAVGKMTVKNLPSSEDVVSVKISALKSGSPVAMAGVSTFNLSTGEAVTYGTEPRTAITLDCSALSLKADSSMPVYFTCLPFSLAASDHFVVEVATATKRYIRDVTLSDVLSFTAGHCSTFGVDMSTATAVAAKDLYLAYEAGAIITIAGKEYSKSVNGESQKINSTEANKAMATGLFNAGVWFLSQNDGCNYAVAANRPVTSETVLVSRYTDKDVLVKFNAGCINFDGGSFAAKGITFDWIETTKNSAMQFLTNSSPEVHFDGCTFIGSKSLVVNNSNANSLPAASIRFFNCNILDKTANNGRCEYINLASGKHQECLKEIVFDNNIIASENGSYLRLVANQATEASGSVETDIVLHNNTFIDATCVSYAYFGITGLRSISAVNNIFYLPKAAANCFILRTYGTVSDALWEKGDNVVYTGGDPNLGFAQGSSTYLPGGVVGVFDKETTAPLTVNNLATFDITVDPAYASHGAQR
ncbi:MAG: hypothetical protein IJQ93_04700 [Bacteroidales bacterium]|nr:hypothetical protein [Bacteroidales bacterium]